MEVRREIYKSFFAANIHKLVATDAVTVDDFRAIAHGLKFCTHISLLKISQCRIGDEGAAALAAALEVHFHILLISSVSFIVLE